MPKRRKRRKLTPAERGWQTRRANLRAAVKANEPVTELERLKREVRALRAEQIESKRMIRELDKMKATLAKGIVPKARPRVELPFKIVPPRDPKTGRFVPWKGFLRQYAGAAILESKMYGGTVAKAERVARLMTVPQLLSIRLDPTTDNFKRMASLGENEIKIDGDLVNPFWYHHD